MTRPRVLSRPSTPSAARTRAARGSAGRRGEPPILVMVHPDSACGSANYHLGGSLASDYRAGLVAELEQHQGPIVILEGMFPEDLAEDGCYRTLARALRDAVERARAAGFAAVRASAPDGEHQEAIVRIARRQRWLPGVRVFHITGCWASANHELAGCVGATVEALRQAGHTATLLDSAVPQPAEYDEWFTEEQEQEQASELEPEGERALKSDASALPPARSARPPRLGKGR